MSSVQLERRIINKAYQNFMEDQTPIQILFGGSSSGKSVGACQRSIIDILNGGRNYLCIRNVKATIKTSIFNEITKTIIKMQVSKLFRINLSDFTITCVNGYQILFGGLDDVMKIKSITPKKGVITDILIEEATEVTENDVKQLLRRMRGKTNVIKRLTLLFNPILIDSWIHRTYFKDWTDDLKEYNDGKVSIRKTTYLDNLDHLDQEDIDILEDETDKYYHDVYTLGNWGVLGNLIFKNWEVRDLQAEMLDLGNGESIPLMQTFDNYRNGIDFGYSADPAALTRSHYDKHSKTIYITNEIYMREMTNDMLAKDVLEIIGREMVVCDSAEPKSIVELRTLGVQAKGARKGKDSVNFGIDWLQRQHIVIDKRCQNTKNELQQYKWKEDKDGNVLKVPVDKNNHIIDALRYAYQDDMEGRTVTAIKAF